MVNVLVVDRDATRCSACLNTLSREDDFSEVHFADGVGEALEKLETEEITVALVSAASMSKDEVLYLCQEAARAHASTKIVVTDVPRCCEAIVGFIEAGARGYVQAGEPPHGLVKYLRTVLRGQALLCPEVAAAVMSRIAELASVHGGLADWEAQLAGGASLTAREREVLKLLQEGLTNREIAGRLVIEIGTVKNHVHNLLEKLGVSSRHEAAAVAVVPQGAGSNGTLAARRN